MSYLDLNVHCVFATKEREPFILESWRNRLHEFLGGCARETGCIPKRIGGVSDHVHMLLAMKGTHAISEVMREVKTVSSRWIHAELGERDFAWQEGFAAFSVSASRVPVVAAYIDRQEEHHRKLSSKEELKQLLLRHGVVYDPRYFA